MESICHSGEVVQIYNGSGARQTTRDASSRQWRCGKDLLRLEAQIAGYPDLKSVGQPFRLCPSRSAVFPKEMFMARDGSFHCELEKSKDEDEDWNKVTTIKCHGELVSDTAGAIKEVVKPLILLGGRIILDLGDVKHLDSAGLGALVGLKTSAINQGLCKLELANMTPGVRELLRITHLTQMFSA